MTRFKINIALIAMFLGVTAAFAFKPEPIKVSKFDTIYYAKATNPNGSQFHWQTNQPSGSCQSGSATCKISTSVTPVDNELPSSYTPLQGPDGASAYR
jgi:hypothetical protein